MTIRIVLQARTSSTRLPAKVLLPVGGMPLAVLCARRLSRGGLDLVLATSNDVSDDELVDAASAAGLPVVRGSLDDVLGRFLLATADLANDDILIRATADNPVPDHDLAMQMVSDFRQTQSTYVGMRSYRNMPYGAAVEIVRLGSLREVAGTTDPIAREHVTSELASRSPAVVPDPGAFDLGLGPVRVTVDRLDDYLIAAHAFRLGGDAVYLPWRAAVQRMAWLRERPA